MGSRKEFLITLIFTENCNLRCTYCYVPKVTNTISKEVLDETLNYIESLSSEGYAVNVSLFGGEPLIAFENLKYFVEKADDIYKKYNDFRMRLFTNGILLVNDDICKFFADREYYIGVNFSIDGAKETHDLSRVYKDGRGSFDDVMKGIKNYCKMINMPIKYIIPKCVVSPENCHTLVNSAKQYLEMGIERISFSIARDNIWDEESLNRYKEEVLRLKDFFIENIDRKIWYDLFSLPILTEKESRCHGYCQAGKKHQAITPNGDIYPCQRFYNNRSPYKLGNILDEEKISNKKADILFKNYKRTNFVDCSKCEVFKDKGCVGMCIASCYEANNNIFSVIPSACEIFKFNYKVAKEIQQVLTGNPNYDRIFDKNRYGG